MHGKQNMMHAGATFGAGAAWAGIEALAQAKARASQDRALCACGVTLAVIVGAIIGGFVL